MSTKRCIWHHLCCVIIHIHPPSIAKDLHECQNISIHFPCALLCVHYPKTSLFFGKSCPLLLLFLCYPISFSFSTWSLTRYFDFPFIMLLYLLIELWCLFHFIWGARPCSNQIQKSIFSQLLCTQFGCLQNTFGNIINRKRKGKLLSKNEEISRWKTNPNTHTHTMWHHHYHMFTYIYSLLIEKGICDRRNKVSMCLCVSFTQRSLHFSVKVFPFFSYLLFYPYFGTFLSIWSHLKICDCWKILCTGRNAHYKFNEKF